MEQKPMRPGITPRQNCRNMQDCEMHEQNMMMDDPFQQGQNMDSTTQNDNSVDMSMDMTGILPTTAPLANPYVPFQREGSKQYDPPHGMIRGTLFPGLDLPFMGMVNNRQKNTPLGELQALCFALVELGEYLDTHHEDKEALQLFEKYQRLYEEGTKTYEQKYGPLTAQKAGGKKSYQWIKNPWPWDYEQQGED